jgi:hypothetical protein
MLAFRISLRIEKKCKRNWRTLGSGDHVKKSLLFQTVVGDGGFEPLGGSSFRPLRDGGSAVSRRLPLSAGPAAPQHSRPVALRGAAAAAAGGRAAPAQGRQQ